MREELEVLVGVLPPETLAELNERSMDSRSLIRAAYKWSGCVDCGRAPWKTGEDYVSLKELDCDHLDRSIKELGRGRQIGVDGSVGGGGRNQTMFSYLVEMIKTEVRCKPCHDKLRGKQRNGQRNGHVETYEIKTLFDDDPTFARGPYKYN